MGDIKTNLFMRFIVIADTHACAIKQKSRPEEEQANPPRRTKPTRRAERSQSPRERSQLAAQNEANSPRRTKPILRRNRGGQRD